MKRILCALAAFFVLALATGCASLTGAGHAAYSVTPFRDTDGTVSGCQLQVADGKEYSGRTISFMGGTCSLAVQEGESKAFEGQAIGAKALTILPVDDLPALLGK